MKFKTKLFKINAAFVSLKITNSFSDIKILFFKKQQHKSH
jgi:hypothetical protein